MSENLIKLIVECDICDHSEAVISKLCRVKYCLPDLGYYIVEVPEADYPRLERLTGIRAVHATAAIAAQSREPPTVANESRFTGQGLSIAFLDTGISPVRDFIEPENRIIAFKDFVNGFKEPYDDNAHGTHVAGIATGNGAASNGRYVGVAPGCGLVGVKILDDKGRGDTAEFLAGIQWTITNKDKYNIRVANMSVGTSNVSGEPLVRAVEAAWDKGIVVCAAAGNGGPGPSTITSPGTSRKVITVGSSDDDKVKWLQFNKIYHGFFAIPDDVFDYFPQDITFFKGVRDGRKAA
ncbi:MAG: S8 family serine peptidase [Defluviitaleaceae bacterium]|nr:S8 family serine peptidase [Defluviitaleaceae bacterium]MCL2835334.1 S8 family serine peptidase [Defluviitaleaceae bacterium]